MTPTTPLTYAELAAEEVRNDQANGDRPINGADLLAEVETFLTRFVAFSNEHYAPTVVLWIAHTHALDSFESTPRLAVLSPEPASGKTRVLEVLDLLVPNPLFTANISVAALFRLTGGEMRPTVLFDEVDTIFTGVGDDKADLRGLLNEGHRAGSTVPRCEGKDHNVKRFPVFAAVALAGLRDLPTSASALASRCIKIPMKPRSPGETVEQFRRKRVRPDADLIWPRLHRWAQDHAHELEYADPTMPEGIADRAADCWEPLFAIADAAGGDWPTRARAAATALHVGRADQSPTVGVALLAACRAAFGESARMATHDLLKVLNDDDAAPWAKWNDGAGIDAIDLAKRLKPFGIRPKKFREGEAVVRGYEAWAFEDAWIRYLPTPVSGDPEQVEHPEHALPCNATNVPAVPAVPASGEPGDDLEAALARLDPTDPDHGLAVAQLRADAARRRIAASSDAEWISPQDGTPAVRAQADALVEHEEAPG